MPVPEHILNHPNFESDKTKIITFVKEAQAVIQDKDSFIFFESKKSPNGFQAHIIGTNLTKVGIRAIKMDGFEGRRATYYPPIAAGLPWCGFSGASGNLCHQFQSLEEFTAKLEDLRKAVKKPKSLKTDSADVQNATASAADSKKEAASDISIAGKKAVEIVPIRPQNPPGGLAIFDVPTSLNSPHSENSTNAPSMDTIPKRKAEQKADSNVKIPSAHVAHVAKGVGRAREVQSSNISTADSSVSKGATANNKDEQNASAERDDSVRSYSYR